MWDSWPDRAKAADRLKREAENVAAALGHRMTAWFDPGRPVYGVERRDARYWVARCLQCKEAAYLNVRVIGRPPLSGPALTVRCEPR